MRTLLIFIKSWREMLRDPWVLGLSLAFAPFFVLLYWLFTQGGSTSYTILVIDHDQGALKVGQSWRAADEVLQAIDTVTYADGKPLLRARRVTDATQAQTMLRERQAVAFVELPPDFSQRLLALQSGDRSAGAAVVFGGDLTNPYYTVGGVLALGAIDSYVMGLTGQQPLVQYTEQPLGHSAARTEFEIYVPGILVFAVIMMIFLSAMTVAREIETGTLRRIQLTPTRALEYIGGLTLAQVSISIIAVVFTFLTAQALGFHSEGGLLIAVLVGALASLSVIGMGMIVAAFSRSVSQAFVIANFPLGLLMFFSGSIFPLPRTELFSIGGHGVSIYDILPATHAVAALNKLFTLGAGLNDVAYELIGLALLSIVYFAVGVYLFGKLHLR
jgi:ABC-2 type transport system permease protein